MSGYQYAYQEGRIYRTEAERMASLFEAIRRTENKITKSLDECRKGNHAAPIVSIEIADDQAGYDEDSRTERCPRCRELLSSGEPSL